MDYRTLGQNCGLKVSPLCLGTMMFGGRADAKASTRIISLARDCGVNFIDTADQYNDGRSEEIVGAAISADRPDWVLASKVGQNIGNGPNQSGLSRKWVLQACDESLRRLGTDYLDIYYLHKEDLETPLEETLSAIGTLIQQGKIRYFGVSNFRSLAGGRSGSNMRAIRNRPASCEPALLQCHEPHAGSGASAGLPSLWLGRRSL